MGGAEAIESRVALTLTLTLILALALTLALTLVLTPWEARRALALTLAPPKHNPDPITTYVTMDLTLIEPKAQSQPYPLP